MRLLDTLVSGQRYEQSVGITANSMDQDPLKWDRAYQGDSAPWDIPEPQPVIQQLLDRAEIQGPVLDLGCGTGENAILLARHGLDVTGIDFSVLAIQRAREKAKDLTDKIDFQVLDVFDMDVLPREFRTVIDCGLFHFFEGESRKTLLEKIARRLHPNGRFFALAFSEEEPGTQGPPRRSKSELEMACDKDLWTNVHVHGALFQTLEGPGFPAFSLGGAKAWLLDATKK